MFKRLKQKLSSIKNSFVGLGFWKKLIIIFTINTIIILIVMNILMSELFNGVSLNILSIIDSQKQEFISLSNSQVASSATNLFLQKLHTYGQFITQVANTIYYFQNNLGIVISLESGKDPFNPPQTSTFVNATFSATGVYFFKLTNTFYDEPYLDVLMSNFFGIIERTQIKRMNIIYQSLNDQSNIFVRTIPGTKDFIIQSVTDINNRFSNLSVDVITISGIYNDTLTLSTPSQLFSLRTTQTFLTYRILIQIQIFQQTLTNLLSNTFYFPSADIVFFKITSNSTYSLMNLNSYFMDLTQCFQTGLHTSKMQGGYTYRLYSTAIDQFFKVGQQPSLTNITQIGDFRLVLVVKQTQLSAPNIFMTEFLNIQGTTLTVIIYGWSFVILLATIGLAIVTGNYIFYNLKSLSAKLQDYTKNPITIHKIIFQLKQLQAKGIIKKLIDNIITIIEKIEQRKKKKNVSKTSTVYPLNIAQGQFLKRHGINQTAKFKAFQTALQQAFQSQSDQQFVSKAI